MRFPQDQAPFSGAGEIEPIAPLASRRSRFKKVNMMGTPAEIIRQLRGKLSQTEFAALVGRRQGDISRWETGQHAPDWHTLADIAAKCGQSLSLQIEECVQQK